MAEEGNNLQLPWGISTKQLQPGSMKTISDSKLATFAIGQQKKSRFQKAREEKELKKKLEDEAASKIYDQFVASFDVSNESRTFVRQGGQADQSASIYKMDTRRASSPEKKHGVREMDRMLEEMKVFIFKFAGPTFLLMDTLGERL